MIKSYLCDEYLSLTLKVLGVVLQIAEDHVMGGWASGHIWCSVRLAVICFCVKGSMWLIVLIHLWTVKNYTHFMWCATVLGKNW